MTARPLIADVLDAMPTDAVAQIATEARRRLGDIEHRAFRRAYLSRAQQEADDLAWPYFNRVAQIATAIVAHRLELRQPKGRD